MRILLLLFFVIISISQANSQVSDRYNFLQKQTDTSILVAWRTSSAGIGTLEWGIDSTNLSNVISNPVSTSKHAYELTGLTPDTKYFYRTSTNQGFISEIDHFYTAKSENSSGFTFLHYGDCGYNNTIQNTIGSLMYNEQCDFGVVTGDVDQGLGNNYDGVYFNVYKDILKNYCHFTAIGNHDTYYDNANTYLDAFYLPTNNPQSSERYYSFIWGNAKFICLDSNIPYTTGTDQYNWLVDELMCRDQQWLFVFFHHPPWTNAWSADYFLPFSEYFLYQGNVDMRTELVPLFEQYDVDFVLNGHSHCYQRGELNGVKYVISGAAGASTLDFNTNSNSPNIDTEIYTNQYVKFNMLGDTAYYLCIDDSGTVIDSVYSEKLGWQPFSVEIVETGGVLIANNGQTFQWYLDASPIAGADSSSFVPTVNGSYQVGVTNEYGCTYYSNILAVMDAEIDEWSSLFQMFPNPANTYVNIVNESSIQGVITIVDVLGNMISNHSLLPNKSLQLNLEGLKKGIYFVLFESENGSNVKRLIVD